MRPSSFRRGFSCYGKGSPYFCSVQVSVENYRGPHQDEGGGLSGAPLFESSTKVLSEFYKASAGRIDLIGVGGISSGQQAYSKIRAGAKAVQLYSALVFKGPQLVTEINDDLQARLKADGFKTLAEAVGTA